MLPINDNFKINYKMIIAFKEEGVVIEFTGESVEFNKIKDNAIVRPRHIKLVTEIQMMLRQYMKENQ